MLNNFGCSNFNPSSVMDIDLDQQNPSTSGAYPKNAIKLPTVDEDNTLEEKSPKQRIIAYLDMLEGHVEKLRKEAAKLEEDKDSLLSSLDSVRHSELFSGMHEADLEDIERYADRITSRCLTVDIKVQTQRDQMQEESLSKVNHLIDGLVISMKTDSEAARTRCTAYMNSCASHFVKGATDKNFESALLGCTVDDQKRVKKRLQGLLNYFEKLE